MTETTDVRQMAAERLAHLGVVQLRMHRRGLADMAPWRDPRQGQGRVLALLKLQPEMSQRDLTYVLGMSRQALAELLGKLEKQGLIEREPSQTDRRVVMIRLTEAGRATDQVRPDVAFGDLLDCLTDDEVTQLADYLGRIMEAFERTVSADSESRFRRLPPFWREGEPGPREGGPRRWGFPGFGPGFARWAASLEPPFPEGWTPPWWPTGHADAPADEPAPEDQPAEDAPVHGASTDDTSVAEAAVDEALTNAEAADDATDQDQQ